MSARTQPTKLIRRTARHHGRARKRASRTARDFLPLPHATVTAFTAIPPPGGGGGRGGGLHERVEVTFFPRAAMRPLTPPPSTPEGSSSPPPPDPSARPDPHPPDPKPPIPPTAASAARHTPPS